MKVLMIAIAYLIIGLISYRAIVASCNRRKEKFPYEERSLGDFTIFLLSLFWPVFFVVGLIAVKLKR